MFPVKDGWKGERRRNVKNFFRKLFRKEKKPEIEVRETRHADGSYDRAIIDNKKVEHRLHSHKATDHTHNILTLVVGWNNN
jgi:hypothetical protein